jgi:hypothetical protein
MQTEKQRCVRCHAEFSLGEGFFGGVLTDDDGFFYCPSCTREWWTLTKVPSTNESKPSGADAGAVVGGVGGRVTPSRSARAASPAVRRVKGQTLELPWAA